MTQKDTVRVEVTQITVVRNKRGYDRVFLHTTLPKGSWPHEETATMSLDIGRDNTKKYLRTHFFRVPVKILEYS